MYAYTQVLYWSQNKAIVNYNFPPSNKKNNENTYNLENTKEKIFVFDIFSEQELSFNRTCMLRLF